MLDPQERAARGAAMQAQITGAAPEPATPYEASLRDFVFAEIWTRPGLPLRDRYLIGMTGTASCFDSGGCTAYAQCALAGAYLSLAELREAALQAVVYSGWTAGGIFDRAVTAAATELGIDPVPLAPLQPAPMDPATRMQRGAAMFEEIARIGAPPPFAPYIEAGVLNFVMGEVWCRPGLDIRSRRIVTLVGAGFSGSATPMRSHAYSAIASGHLSKDELLEFVLHFSVHGGWPRGSVFQGAVLEQARRVEQGLPFEP
jgi:4-carboxymuconolactone decarboxylase